MKKFTRILKIAPVIFFSIVFIYNYLPKYVRNNLPRDASDYILGQIRDPDSAFLDTLSVDLPHYLYKRLTDSVRAVEQHKKFSFFISEAFSIGNGVAGISGSLKFPNYHMEENTRVETPTFPSVSDFKDPVFYMGISGYEINNQISIADKPVFFHNNGKDSIKYWDLVPARGQYEHVEDSLVTRKKASPFYYYESQKAILFPASKAGYITFKILFYLSMFSYGVAFFCVLFCVIRLCLAIADGQFFTPKNLDRLYIIAAAVFTPFFINWLVSTIMTWIYLPKAGGDVFLINKEGPNILSLAPGYLLFLFAGAFKRGLELQEEHDLTV